MREINLNGYIDDEVWFGDEITPESLHEALYGADNQHTDDVHIRLNSYGGSCNAATRMFDDIRAYPGNVWITVSGTAASAATVLSMAADKLEMTPGSLWMIHDPSVLAWGNERDLMDSINLLKACKESILNMYARRCRWNRIDVATMMTATTWMDAQSALSYGFIDAIADTAKGSVENVEKPHIVDKAEAERKVQAWLDRHKPQLSRPVKNALQKQEVSPVSEDSLSTAENPPAESVPLPGDDHTSPVPSAEEQNPMPDESGGTAPPDLPEESDRPDEPPLEQETPAAPEPPIETGGNKQPEETGIPVAQLHKRLGLLMPAKRSLGRKGR